MAPPQHPSWKNLAIRQGKTFRSAMPTQIVSNEEFAPFSQTADQSRVEEIATALVEQSAARRGLTRRDFLKTTGGTASALLAMNSVFGRFFNIGEIELFETSAFAEQQGAPYFIFDVQTHYVASHYDPTDAEEHRKGGGVQTRVALPAPPHSRGWAQSQACRRYRYARRFVLAKLCERSFS